MIPPAKAILSRLLSTLDLFLGSVLPLTIVLLAASASHTDSSKRPFSNSFILAWLGLIPIAPRMIYGTGSPFLRPM
jgi:hypothetical protein